MPESTTPIAITKRIRKLKTLPSMDKEGQLMAGKVMMSAAAGPEAIPNASIACTMGTSPAVGITKCTSERHRNDPANAVASSKHREKPSSGCTEQKNQNEITVELPDRRKDEFAQAGPIADTQDSGYPLQSISSNAKR